jgi:FdhE protein
MDSNIHEIEEGLNRLHDKEYISESSVNFFRDIIRAQYKVKDQLDEIKISSTLSEEKIKEMMINGKPLVSWKDIPLEEAHLKELFQEICKIIKKQDKNKAEEIQKLIDAESDGKLKLITLIEKLFFQDSTYFHSLTGELKVDEQLLLFLALHLARPFFEAVAEKLNNKVVDKLWIKNYCPVCGSGAQIAKLEKEVGKRKLYCLLCGSEWEFYRLICPFCNNKDQKDLKFLEEEGSSYRIDVCDQCKRYIKTLDERKGGGDTGKAIPSVEDLATMYLDVVAEKEGYEKSWFFPPSAGELKANTESKTRH